MTGTSYQSCITPILKELHLLPVQHRIQYKILVHTYNALHFCSPLCIKDMLNTCRRCSRPLRSQNWLTLVTPRVRTAQYGKDVLPTQLQIWNVLPDNIREARTIFSFKKLLKTLLSSALWALII